MLATIATLLVAALALFAVVVIAFRPPEPLAVPQSGVVLADVNLVNPGGERRGHVDLTIRGGKIQKIADHPVGRTEGQANSQFAGNYALPGLIDLHVHSTQDPSGTSHDIELFSLLYLANGVTAVRDTGNFDGTILKTRAAIAEGQFAGPRIFACGPIFDGDPPFWPRSLVVHNAEEARRGVDKVAATGVDCIKAYSFLTADALAGLREGAAKHGLPIIGHVPLAVPFEDAHLDDVQHLTGVPGPTKTTTGTELAQSWIELDSARIEFIVRTSLQEKIAHTPTIAVWQQMAALSDYPSLLKDPDARLLPRYYRELLWKPGGLINTQAAVTDSWRALGAALPNMTLMVRRLHEAGVTLHVGTDVLNPFVIPGVSLHQELRNFVKAGFTPDQALEAATRGNGAALPEPKLGTIAEGAPADLAIYRRDPTLNLAALSTLEAVVANGRLYSKESIDAAIGRYRDRFEGWVYEQVTMSAARAFAARAQKRN